MNIFGNNLDFPLNPQPLGVFQWEPEIFTLEPGRYLIESERIAGKRYIVDFRYSDAGTCECPDFNGRRKGLSACKHIGVTAARWQVDRALRIGHVPVEEAVAEPVPVDDGPVDFDAPEPWERTCA